MRSVGLEESRLRPWQQQALVAYDSDGPRRDFLLTATPGAGKTTFALAVASRLLQRRVIDRVVVVCPTDHLRTQWADAAGQVGVVLDPKMTNAQGPIPAGAHGYVTTYAQVAGRPAIHAARCQRQRTLVVLDEIHHAGDGLSWGEATAEAFSDVHRRLSLTGTPFRTKPGERIPFVDYEIDGELLRSVADYTYGYRQALADRVVRPVVFAAYTGVSRWRNSAGEVIAASLTDAGTQSVSRRRPGRRRWTRPAAGCRTSSPRWTSGSPTCGNPACRTPPASCWPATRTTPAPTPGSSNRSPGTSRC